jgi:predicted DNA-binding protein YlxM (UPF0122 family)
MAREPKFTDAQLRRKLEEYEGVSDRLQRIADDFGVSKPAVSQRIGRLKETPAVSHPKVVRNAVSSVFDIRTNLERLNEELWSLTEQSVEVDENGSSRPTDKVRVYAEIRQVLALAKNTLETVYTVQKIETFIDEVLNELEYVDPDARKRILERLERRATVSAAFSANPAAFSG